MWRLTLCEQTAGDLMQELFVKLFNYKDLDKIKVLSAYARRVALNLAFEWRKKQKIKTQSLDDDCLPSDNSPSALENMIQAEELNQILDATSQLNALAREVVVMRYLEEKSFDEIARQLNEKPPYMRSLCTKALAQIRKILVVQEKNISP